MESGKDREPDPQTEDLRNMLMRFRISELQEVLCAAGRPRSGRKHELLGRALSLLRQSEGTSLRERVKNRIVELHRLRFPIRQYQGVDIPQNNGPTLIQPRKTTSDLLDSSNSLQKRGSHEKQSSLASLLSHEDSSSIYDKYTTQKAHIPTTLETLIRPQKGQPNCVSSSEQSLQLNGSSCHDGMPVHPDVRFISLPFAELQDVLIKATSLGQKRMSGYQDITLVFHLSPLQVQTITHSRSYSLQSRIEYNVQVLLRFCLAETSCIQEDSYPSRCSIKVNGKICPIPGQPPPNSQNMEPKKPHRPVNITSYCRLSPMMANQRHAASVQLVKCVTASTLVQRLKAKPLRNADHARALIKEQLAHDPDNEVATTSLKVSLCCPIGKTRMTMPCRATTCNHVQCFDGSLYIQMNERKPNWTCPVCDKKAFYDQLIVDGLFTEILRSAPDSNDIVFLQDGSWKVQSDNDLESKASIMTIIGTPSSSSRGEESTTTTTMKQRERDFCMIDLTGDSSDEEEPPPPPIKSKPMSYNANISHHRGPRVRQVPMVSSSTIQYHPFPLFDPEIQAPDFYSVLPEEERGYLRIYTNRVVRPLTSYRLTDGTTTSSDSQKIEKRI
eukprot:gene5897-11232_t